MSTITVTNTQTEKKRKNKKKDLETITASRDLNEVLDHVKKIDNTCSFLKCKVRTTDIAIHCRFCNNRFCTIHGLPEIHGCGEAVRRDERRKFMHPDTSKLNEDNHEKVSAKLTQKLKQMQSERKSKQGFQNKGKKK